MMASLFHQRLKICFGPISRHSANHLPIPLLPLLQKRRERLVVMAVCPARAIRVLAFDPHAAGLVLHLGLGVFGSAAFCR